jgi:hypothetical protein
MNNNYIPFGIIAILICLLIYVQIKHYRPEYKLLYLVICLLMVYASKMEIIDDNGYYGLNNSTLACKEATRVNWRIAYMLSFFILVILNVVKPQELNFLIFMLTFFTFYYYLNFNQHHKFLQACKQQQ